VWVSQLKEGAILRLGESNILFKVVRDGVLTVVVDAPRDVKIDVFLPPEDASPEDALPRKAARTARGGETPPVPQARPGRGR
jgi:hypothetical protein